MPSGFFILPDGRCFSPRWRAYDRVIRDLCEHLTGPDEQELRKWLLEQLPRSDDIEDLGFGPWLRESDGQLIERFLDLRELSRRSRESVLAAIKRAAETLSETGPSEPAFTRLLELLARTENGEPPLNGSDWREVVPSKGRRLGPGWGAVED